MKARLHLPGREGIDCMLRWANCRHPRLHQGHFTAEVDAVLQEIVKAQGYYDWKYIASILSAERIGETLSKVDSRLKEYRIKYHHTFEKMFHSIMDRRSATQCAGRFKAHLNQNLIQRSWTSKEDGILYRFVQHKGVGRWSEAVLQLSGHTHAQALHRWDKVLKPSRRKGSWLPEEDDSLRLIVATHALLKGSHKVNVDFTETSKGQVDENEAHSIVTTASHKTTQVTRDLTDLPWSKVAVSVATRSDVQCRERWTNILSRDIRRAEILKWNQADDEALCAMINACTYSSTDVITSNSHRDSIIAWSHVALRLGRHFTDKICRNRYRKLRRVGERGSNFSVKLLG